MWRESWEAEHIPHVVRRGRWCAEKGRKGGFILRCFLRSECSYINPIIYTIHIHKRRASHQVLAGSAKSWHGWGCWCGVVLLLGGCSCWRDAVVVGVCCCSVLLSSPCCYHRATPTTIVYGSLGRGMWCFFVYVRMGIVDFLQRTCEKIDILQPLQSLS